MNPILRFYIELLRFVKTDQDTAEKRQKILTLAANTPGLSWNCRAKDISDVHFMCSNHDKYCDPKYESADYRSGDEFALAAFKDLSVMKNPHAMAVFTELNKLVCHEAFLTFFATKIHRRKDGSAIITLHVSDMSKAQRLFDSEDCANLKIGLKKRVLTDGGIINQS